FPWTGRDYAMRRLEVLTNDGYLNSDHDHTTWEVLYFDEKWRVEHEPAPPPPKPPAVVSKPKPVLPTFAPPPEPVTVQPLLAAVAIQPELPQMPEPSYVKIDFTIGSDNRISNADRVLWLQQQFRDRSFGSAAVNEFAGKPGVPFLDKFAFSNLVARMPREFYYAFTQVPGVSPRQWKAQPIHEAVQQAQPVVAASTPVVVKASPVVVEVVAAESVPVVETEVCDPNVIAENAALKSLLAERLAALAAAEREATERTTQAQQEHAHAAQLDALVNPLMSTIVWGQRFVRLLDKLSGSGKAP
ncbi:MAG: hypothetical protein NT003_01045, partial [Candidatus Magasanikbacteria bacterium]|nr:hypothetical protein [Candidatus Magasanikbacteria bacterium]